MELSTGSFVSFGWETFKKRPWFFIGASVVVLIVYVVAGSNLYVATGSSSLKTIPLGQAAKDVAVSEQGSFAYVANSNNSVDVFATCNNAKLGSNSVALAAVPQRIVSSIDGSKIYAVTPPSMSIISPMRKKWLRVSKAWMAPPRRTAEGTAVEWTCRTVRCVG